jgi:hypothetical protein
MKRPYLLALLLPLLAIGCNTAGSKIPEITEIADSTWEADSGQLVLAFKTSYASDGATVASLNFTITNNYLVMAMPSLVFDPRYESATTIAGGGESITGTYSQSRTYWVETLNLAYSDGTTVPYTITFSTDNAGTKTMDLVISDTLKYVFSLKSS